MLPDLISASGFPATLISLQWSITSSPNSGTVYGSGIFSGGNLRMPSFPPTSMAITLTDFRLGLYLNLDTGTVWITSKMQLFLAAIRCTGTRTVESTASLPAVPGPGK